MGRGRAKAKQTKVARELKYNTPQTDFDALRAELANDKPHNDGSHRDGHSDDDPVSTYNEEDDR